MLLGRVELVFALLAVSFGATSGTAATNVTSCGSGERYDASLMSCLPCATGSFMANSAHLERECEACTPGRYTFLPGMSECWSCPTGSSSAAQAGSCTLNLTCSPCTDRAKIKVRAVVHGQRSDLFWLRVERAMATAAAQLRIDFQVYLQVRNSQDAMAEMITNVVETEAPDVLLVTIPGPTVAAAVGEAAKQVHVFSLNSGFTDFEAVGVKAHFSMDEGLGGYQAAARFAASLGALPMRSCVFINHEFGNSALNQRRTGFQTACEELNLKWLPEVVVGNANVDEHELAIALVISNYMASASAQSGGLGILLAGEATVDGAMKAYEAAGRPPEVSIGSFDLGADVLAGLSTGDLAFGIDQQEWLQGYMSVLIATLYVTTGNLMAPKVYPTGPAFLVEVPSSEQATRQGEAFPVCDCPWSGGLEANLVCGEEPIGQCPLETNDCAAECMDVRQLKFRGVVHGHEADAFWFVVKAGAEQAANDLRLIDFAMDYWAPPGSDRADAFDENLFAATVRSTADDPEVDGLFVSIHGDYLHEAITHAASKTRVVTINSGSDVSQSLNPAGGQLIGHVGMDEFSAGVGAARMLANAGVRHVIVVDHDSGNGALKLRKAGAQEYLNGLGLELTHADIIGDGIDVGSDDAVSQYVVGMLEADPSIDGLLCLGASMVRAARSAMRAVNRPIVAGSFDSSDVLLESIVAGEYFIFGVDQQQYMQGYMAVMALYIHTLTLQKLASYVIESGPYFITGSEPSKDACINLPWTGEIVGSRLMPSFDAAFTVGFPICEYAGNCQDPSLYFNITLGQCRPCDAGSFKNSSMEACHQCPAGTSTGGQTGATECAACSAGKFGLAGDADCTFCSRGSFQGQIAATACDSCEVPFTTLDIAQRTNASCICPSGMYRNLDGNCDRCPKMMNCEIGSDIQFFYGAGEGPIPMLESGYMSLVGEPLKAYKCEPDGRCPGGVPGTCEANMDTTAVGCGTCMDDSYQVGDKCEKCGGGADFLPFIFAVLFGIAGVCIVTLVINRNLLMQSNATLMCVLMFGMLVTGCQTLGVFDELALEWDDLGPMRAIFSVMGLLSFNLSVIKIGCITGSSPVPSYVGRQLIAPFSIPFAFIVLLFKRYRKPKTNVFMELTNTVGTVFSIFLISVVVSAVSPFICYKHPVHPDGAETSSMRSAPSILCYEGGDHTTLMIVGILAFCMVPVPFMVCVAYFCHRYPRFVALGDVTRLGAFRFLYFRYQPQRYYHGMLLLSRNALVPLIPAFLQEEALQVIVLCALFLVYMIVQQQLNPWRVPIANVVEGIINAFLIVLLLCGAMATDMSASTETLSALALVSFASFVAVLFIAFAVGFFRRLKPNPYFDFFICHHKKDAAAQARLLKVILLQRTNGSKAVFIDSDDLKELDQLFDTVKTGVGHLVVYLTKDTLTRPWCAGEIVTACASKKTQVFAVRHKSFVPPMERQLKDLDSYLDLSSCNLMEYGMTNDDIANAFGILLNSKSTPQIVVTGDSSQKGSLRWDPVAAFCMGQTSKLKQSCDPVPSSPEMLALSCDSSDDEAVASQCILRNKIFQEVDRILEKGICMLCDHTEQDIQRLERFISISRSVLVMLSKNSLYSTPQLHVIAKGVQAGRQMIPINLPTFAFPSDDYYAKNLPIQFPQDVNGAQRRLQTFFKTISVSFSVHSSDQILDAQAAEVIRRIANQGGASIGAVGSVRSQKSSGPTISSQRSQGSAQAEATPRRAPVGISTFADEDDDDDIRWHDEV